MNRPNRSSSGGRQPQGAPADPFAGFGFGFGSGHSLIDDFFNKDPFDDPFFTRPFGGMFGAGGGGGLFGSGGFFGQGSVFGPRFNPFGSEGHGFLDQRPFNPQPEGRRGPIIEELDEDHPDAATTRPRSSQEPIVEHPDDEVRPAGSSHPSRNIVSRNQSTNQPGSNFQSYSFHSSTVSYGGPSGTYYSSSTKRAAGPNGVVAEEHHEKESSGKETRRISRGIRDKGRSLTRKRNAEGEESNVDTLHNLTEEEANDFEKNWEATAERSLPGWNKNRSRALNSGSASRPALEGGSTRGWRGARQS